MYMKTALVVTLLALVPVARGGGAKEDYKKFEGTWLAVEAELNGQKFPEEVRKTVRLILAGDQYTVKVGPSTDKGTFKVDSTKKPMSMDITGTDGPNKGKTFLAIYELKGDTLRVCYDLQGKIRPTEFASKEGSLFFLATYKREKGAP